MEKIPSHPGISVSKASIEEAVQVKPSLQRYATRLRKLDKDGNNVLDLDEICEAIDDMVELEKQRRLLMWVAAILGVFAILVTLATVGLTWAVVSLTKDTSVSNGVLLTKSGDTLTLGSYALEIVEPDPAEVSSEEATPGRRLLQQTTDMGVCFESLGYVSRTAIDGLCKKLAKNDVYFTMQYKDPTCGKAGAVSLGTSGSASGRAQNGVCGQTVLKAQVTSHFCDILNQGQKLACSVPIVDTSRSATQWDILYAKESTNSATRTYESPYKISFKAGCTNVKSPKFTEWFKTGELLHEIPCS